MNKIVTPDEGIMSEDEWASLIMTVVHPISAWWPEPSDPSHHQINLDTWIARLHALLHSGMFVRLSPRAQGWMEAAYNEAVRHRELSKLSDDSYKELSRLRHDSLVVGILEFQKVLEVEEKRLQPLWNKQLREQAA